MNNKNILAAAAVLSVVGMGLFTANTAFAQAAPEPVMMIKHDHMTSLVQRISEKFGLKQEDVQAVFDQEHAAHQAEMEAAYAAKLSQLVTDGKITEAQKSLLLSKHTEQMAKRQSMKESLKDKTPAEHKAAMEAEKKAMEEWAKQNGIDLQYLRPLHGQEKIKVRGMRGM